MSRGKLLSIKSRISSINNIFDLSKAMELVSSSKFSNLQHLLGNASNYSEHLEEIISEIIPFSEKKKHSTFIIIGSDKGLCGSYNNNILRFCKDYFKDKELSKNDKFLIMGKKIFQCLKKGFQNIHVYSSTEDIFSLCSKILDEIISIDTEIFIIYTDYKGLKLDIKIESLLPLSKKSNEEFIFETNKDEMFKKLLSMYLKFRIYKSILSALISEHYSRMVAMRSAYDNAEDLMSDLKRFYNKERQLIITQEILEIINGCENFNEV